ncbi:MAG: hypothetical protein EOO29_08365 [Comamonadaceae bacterium]|nr:MAG: hypothetical protein EOO29_08365 [Comamonadaceae bacterium]
MATEISIVLSGKDETKAAFASLQRNVDQAGAGVSKMQGLFAGAFAGLSISGTISKFISETRSAEDEQAQLAAAVRSTGGAAGFTVEQLNGMAAELSNVSTISEGAINDGQTRLITYTGIVGERFKEAQELMVDYAVRMKTDLPAAAEVMGRALDTPSRGMVALQRQGFKFSEDQIKLAKQLEDTGRKAEAQGIVIAALRETYGGAAKAARDTFGGAISALQNNIDDLLTGDTGSMRVLKESVESLNQTLESEDTKRAFQTLIGWMTQASKIALEAGTDIVNFLSSPAKGRILGDYARSEFGMGGRVKGDRLAGSNIQAANRDIEAANRMISANRSEAEVAGARKLLDESMAARAYWQRQQRQQALDLVDDYPDEAARRAGAPAQPKATGGGGGGGGGGSKSKKDAEAEAKRAIEALQKQVEKARELSEVEQVLLDIQRTRDGGGRVTEVQKQTMLQLAAQLDSAKEVKKLEKERADEEQRNSDGVKARREEGIALMEQMRTPLQAYTAEVARLNGLLKDGSIDQATHTRALSQAWQQYDGAEKALKNLNDSTDEFSKRAAGNIQDQLGDGLYNVLTGNFDNIGKAWGQMLARMVAEAAAAKLSRSMFGDLVQGGSGSGWFGSALKAFGGALGLAGGGAAAGGMWGSTVSAGMGSAGAIVNLPKFDIGTNYVPQDMLAMVHKGEKIVPAKYNRAADPDAQAGGASLTFAPVINIDSRSDRAAVQADTQRTVGQALRQYTEQLKRAGAIPS